MYTQGYLINVQSLQCDIFSLFLHVTNALNSEERNERNLTGTTYSTYSRWWTESKGKLWRSELLILMWRNIEDKQRFNLVATFQRKAVNDVQLDSPTNISHIPVTTSRLSKCNMSVMTVEAWHSVCQYKQTKVLLVEYAVGVSRALYTYCFLCRQNIPNISQPTKHEIQQVWQKSYWNPVQVKPALGGLTNHLEQSTSTVNPQHGDRRLSSFVTNGV